MQKYTLHADPQSLPKDSELKKRLEWGLVALEKTHAVIMDFYRRDIQVEVKADHSFVTDADRLCEKLLREMLAQQFPQDGIIGEEFQDQNKEGPYTWTIDPIDGTSSFVHRVPLFGTMLGLIHKDEAILGLVHFPALNETIYAARGQGAWWSPSYSKEFQRCWVKPQSVPLPQATFSYSAAEYFKRNNREHLLEALRQNVGFERVWGDCYGHMLVATGRLDIMVDPGLAIWDLVPIKVISEEAGGEFFGIDGSNNLEAKNGGISCHPDHKQKLLDILLTQ